MVLVNMVLVKYGIGYTIFIITIITIPYLPYHTIPLPYHITIFTIINHYQIWYWLIMVLVILVIMVNMVLVIIIIIIVDGIPLWQR